MSPVKTLAHIVSVRKIYHTACPFWQVQTKMHLHKSPLFRDSLARASGQVVMLVPTGDIRSSMVYTVFDIWDFFPQLNRQQ